MQCVVAASLSLQSERAGIDVLHGRQKAVNPLLPANPQLALSGAHRQVDGSQAGNWSATLSQELEISGQRSARRAAATAATNAQQHAVVATERDVAAEAWRRYFEALAAREALETATHLEQALASSQQAASAGAAQGLLSGIDAELTDLALVQLTQMRIEAQRRAREAKAALASLLGINPQTATLRVDGELTPLSTIGVERPDQVDAAVERRPEIAGASETRRSQLQAVSTLRRSRVPNITLSIFAQQDGFRERVLGGGVSVPIPLPYPLGRTLAGEIAESEALVRQADLALETARRDARLELVTALQTFEAAKAQNALFTAPRMAEAARSLASIAEEIRAGRLAISTAVVAQQNLIEFLRARIQAQLELCLASVELARTAGAPLNGEPL